MRVAAVSSAKGVHEAARRWPDLPNLQQRVADASKRV